MFSRPTLGLSPFSFGLFRFITYFWPPVRPLRLLFVAIFVLYLAEYGISCLGETIFWTSRFPATAAFTTGMLGIQLRRLMVTGTMVLVMWAAKGRWSGFYLVPGDLNARVEPVRWLGIAPGATWGKVGWVFSLAISLGTLTFLLLAGHPSSFLPVLPLLPLIIILAALNAFNEEMSYRAALLGSLQDVIHEHWAVWMTAVYFGIGHYYGVPYGMIGVLMASFLGCLLGKSMVETRGFFWAWFIHFLQDIAIFTFMALGSMQAGGGK